MRAREIYELVGGFQENCGNTVPPRKVFDEGGDGGRFKLKHTHTILFEADTQSKDVQNKIKFYLYIQLYEVHKHGQ